mmetsp:Transcript_127593/g.272032  ORF Transcript_127593/g.272032 Transcript_127593/m.272032 type:complete len:959 (+) Transcript_127593:55-2931(+)
MASSWCKPGMTVYLPRYVTIHNRRLAIFYWFLLAVMVGAAVYDFVQKQKYLSLEPVSGVVHLSTDALRLQAGVLASAAGADLLRSFCKHPASFAFEDPRDSYGNITCASPCSAGAGAGVRSCLAGAEYAMVPRPSNAFYPTFFIDTWSNGTTRQHFVPGVEDQVLAFSHRVRTQRPFLYSFPVWFRRLLSYSPGHRTVGSSEANREKREALQTVLLSNDGSVLRNFQAGELVTITVAELLAAARPDEFGDAASRLALDDFYTRPEEGILSDGGHGPSMRLTGADLEVRIEYRNDGYCQMDAKLPRQQIKHHGSIACMSIRAARGWTTMERRTALGLSGGSFSRRYHGLQVHFVQFGAFRHVELGKIFEGLTTVIIWAQIPIFIIYIFLCNFLGNHSTLYSRCVHQSVSVSKAITGLAARLLPHSSAYMDILNGGTGLGRRALNERLRVILAKNKHLGNDEVERLSGFLFERLRRQGTDDEEAEASVEVQEFCAACTHGEIFAGPTGMRLLARALDEKRPLGCLEGLFNDKCVRGWRDTLQKEADAEAAAKAAAEAAAEAVVRAAEAKAAEAAAAEEKAAADAEEAEAASMAAEIATAQEFRLDLDEVAPVIEDEEGDEQQAERQEREQRAVPQVIEVPARIEESLPAEPMEQLPPGASATAVVLEDVPHSFMEKVTLSASQLRSRFRELQPRSEAVLEEALETYKAGGESVFELRRRELAAEEGPPERRSPVKAASGATFTGEWVRHYKHGSGVEVWPDGSRYEGQWQVGKVHGYCIYRNPNGAKYEGEWRHGKQHGEGTETSEEGTKYVGQFRAGRKSGRGTFTQPDGSTYEGEVEANMMNGAGVYNWANGQRFRGQWHCDGMSGDGVYTWPDGMKFVGQYRNNMKEGEGVFTWPDGRKFEGTYKDNQRDGPGVLTLADGSKTQARWVDGKLHGDGCIISSGGRVETCSWINGERVS